MRPPSLLPLLLLGIALWVMPVLSQSISIVRSGTNDYSIAAFAPAGKPQTLQESVNLRLWLDLREEVNGSLSQRISGEGVNARFYRLVPSAPPPPPIVVVLIGDSSVGDCCGWGRGIYDYFKSTARVVNLAMPRYSAKRFLREIEYTTMLTIRPEYVLIQFGWHDACLDCPGIGSSLPEYADNLRTILRSIRGFYGAPILVTAPPLRVFDAQGKVVPFLEDRVAVMRDVAAETQTPLIDLYQGVKTLFNGLGDRGSAYLTYEDNTHFTPAGAPVIAGLVVNALPPSLGPYLTGIFGPPLGP